MARTGNFWVIFPMFWAMKKNCWMIINTMQWRDVYEDHNPCYSWVCLMGPCHYGWLWLQFKQFNHEVIYLSRLQVRQSLLTALNNSPIWLEKYMFAQIFDRDIFCSSKFTFFSENCVLLGTDNVHGQLTKHIFMSIGGNGLFIYNQTDLVC